MMLLFQLQDITGGNSDIQCLGHSFPMIPSLQLYLVSPLHSEVIFLGLWLCPVVSNQYDAIGSVLLALFLEVLQN